MKGCNINSYFKTMGIQQDCPGQIKTKGLPISRKLCSHNSRYKGLKMLWTTRTTKGYCKVGCSSWKQAQTFLGQALHLDLCLQVMDFDKQLRLTSQQGQNQDFIAALIFYGLPWWCSGKESACNTGDVGLIPGSGRSPGEGNGNPHQYSCLENSMDREAWWVTVHGVTKSQAQLSAHHKQYCTHPIGLFLQRTLTNFHFCGF